MQDKTHDPCFLSSLVAQLLCQPPVPSPFNTSDTHRHSLFHCCHKRSDKSNISKQGSVLARFCRVQSLLTRMAWSQRQLAHGVHSQDAGRGVRCCFAAVFLPIQSRTSGHGMTLPTFRAPNLETPSRACPQFCLLGGFRACPS